MMKQGKKNKGAMAQPFVALGLKSRSKKQRRMTWKKNLKAHMLKGNRNESFASPISSVCNEEQILRDAIYVIAMKDKQNNRHND